MLIGLTGYAGSGKDAAYGFIAEWAESQGRPVRRDAFADRLKLSAARALGFEGTPEEAIAFCNDLKEDAEVYVHASTDWVPRTAITGRQFLQKYGTEAHREIFGYDFWIAAVLDNYTPTEILVVPDVRFENEAKAIQALGGQVWEIRRPGTDVDDQHVSEQGINEELVDRVIANDGSLAHLRDLVLSSFERVTV